MDEKLDAGTYIVETLEELIDGLSFVAFRRVSTTIVRLLKDTAKVLDNSLRLTHGISKQRKN